MNQMIPPPHNSSNKLSRDGARHLSVLLQYNTPLTALDIGYNRIEDEGLVHISNTLANTNHTLTRYIEQ